jgi:hypothetical protein
MAPERKPEEERAAPPRAEPTQAELERQWQVMLRVIHRAAPLYQALAEK